MKGLKRIFGRPAPENRPLRGEETTRLRDRRRLIAIVLLWSGACLLLAAASRGDSTLPPVDPRTPPSSTYDAISYRIDARFDPSKKTIDATEVIRWKNPGTEPVSELQFHLYLNAFKNNHSTFMRESGGQLRGDKMDSKSWGAIDVRKLTGPGGVDLTKSAHFASPDDGNAADETVWVVPLPNPVAPGESIEVTVEFRSTLPKVFARTGYHGDFFLAGQWFPKLGVYEPPGMRGRRWGAWNCHQFHAESEFYADYGTFDVTLHYPSRFVIGAVGDCVETRDAAGQRTSRFVAESVHDFAFTLWPRFHVVKDRFDPVRDVPRDWMADSVKTLGLTEAELALTPVEITYLEVPGREGHRQRQLTALKKALAWFGLHFGAYPYRSITFVDVPNGADGAGGMEYPTFFTTLGLSRANARRPLSGVRFGEQTTIHEFGHQFFYGLIGSNEFEEAWLDEGFTSYGESRAMEAIYGESAGGDLLGIKIPPASASRIGYADSPGLDSLDRFAWDFSSASSYFTKSYGKTDLVLQTLRIRLGPARFDRAMRAYATRWRFRHPSGKDFRAVMEQYAGGPIADWDALFQGSAWVDFAVHSYKVEREKEEGLFDRAAGRVTLPEKNEKKGTAPGGDKDESGPRTAIVRIENNGSLRCPVTIRFVFRSGTREETVDRTWDGDGEWVRYKISAKWNLDRVIVDPDDEIPIDTNRTNDSWTRKSNPAGVTKISSWIFFVVSGFVRFLAAVTL